MRNVIFHFFWKLSEPKRKETISESVHLSNLKLSLGQNDGVGSVDVFAIVN